MLWSSPSLAFRLKCIRRGRAYWQFLLAHSRKSGFHDVGFTPSCEKLAWHLNFRSTASIRQFGYNRPLM